MTGILSKRLPIDDAILHFNSGMGLTNFRLSANDGKRVKYGPVAAAAVAAFQLFNPRRTSFTARFRLLLEAETAHVLCDLLVSALTCPAGSRERVDLHIRDAASSPPRRSWRGASQHRRSLRSSLISA